MNYKIHAPRKSFPRLMIDRSATTPGELVGFLQVSSTGKKIKLGNPQSREFRLVQCLFSPNNFMSAKFEPVLQTYERAFGAIRVKADDANRRLAARESAEGEMAAIVNRSMRNLQKGELGEHFSFISQAGKIRMSAV